MKTSQSTDRQERRIALFPGSFDPFTRGHESIVTRALPLFDEIIIAIGVNINKQALTSMDLRQQLIESAFAHEPKVKVITYTGLTTDAAREHNANFLLRGVRMIQDFENEMNMAEVNRELSGIETILLYTLPEYSHISSSIVRELVKYGQDVTSYLPHNTDWQLVPEHWISNKHQ
ncbi:MAG: pantetheine-phosphate adenylyltransferase [Muribaculaceae bacterium]|nr:pantetheine-phosphate adenylyltransferase [Muribaculaceae bacterium]MBQ4139170.1 pantetheine-phosphate adenylyltransferase [Muribaculaceae bacterium]